MTPVMYSDISGYAPEWWNAFTDWIDNTFGFQVCVESGTCQYNIITSDGAGAGVCNGEMENITFFITLPKNILNIKDYSYGIKFADDNGDGIKIFGGPKVGFGTFSNGRDTTYSFDIRGRFTGRYFVYKDDGTYTFSQTSFNFYDTVVVASSVVIFYRLGQKLNPYA